MIQTNTTSNYQIKHLVNNPINDNKFIYIDSIDGNLVIKNNKWFFDLNYYVIDNATLPPNIFNACLELPFADIKDIQLLYVASGNIPSWVTQKENCKIYKSTFSIDTNESKFFDQILTKYLMYLQFSFDINTNVVNNSSIDVTQSDLDSFILEWNLIHQTLSFDFSNFVDLNDDGGVFGNGNQYYLNSKTGYSISENNISYQLNENLSDRTFAINNLLTLKTSSPFLINKIITKFHYSIEDVQGINTYENTNNDLIYVYDTYDIEFNKKTLYDEAKNEVVDSLNGVEGFYIPKKSNGYFEVLVTITQNENARIYRFMKDFNFIDTKSNTKIMIKEIFINDLNNFERMEF